MHTSHPRSIAWRLLIISLFVAVGSACVPISATKVGTEARTIDITDVRPVPIIQFDSATMTDARAKTIGETAGFKYIGWRPCNGNLQHCAVFKVQGRRGNIFEYYVADQNCFSFQPSEPLERPLDLTKRYASQARIIKPKPAMAEVFKPIFEQPISTAEEGNATDCFAGYTAMLRVRQENSYTSDNLGYILVTEHIYQVLQNKRWTDTITVLNNAWRVPVSGTGMTNEGYSYEFLDSTGTSVAKDSYEINWIASSGTAAEGASLAERCEAQKDVYQSKQNVAVQSSYAACKLFTPIPDCANVEGSLEPLGVGGSISLSKCGQVCETSRDALSSIVQLAASEMYADCLENPGRYFPKDYKPVPDDLVVDDDVFKPMTYDTMVFEGDSCPAFYIFEYGFSLGGMDCTVQEPRTCERDSQGECVCKIDDRIGSNIETVCTGE